MTDVIDIHDWKGNELINEFIDFVNTGTANARAIVSQDTGSLYDSVRIKKIPDGYLVYSNPYVLRRKSGKKYYYAYRYAVKGYPRYEPFHFIYEGFMNIGESSIGDRTFWKARGGRGRRGSGYGSIRDIKIPMRVRKTR